MKLLHLTDIHLTTPGNTIGGRDPNANFDRALAHALAHHGDAEAIFITGDLSDWGEREDYLRLKARIAECPVPIHPCLGNHDDRSIFLEVFPEYRDAAGFTQRIVPLSSGHAVLLDTVEAGSHAGGFCAARATWLAGRLAALEGPLWIFLHHNPVPTGIALVDEIMLRDADRLAGVLAPESARIRHILHGHCHMVLSGSFCGIPFSGPRGTNHAGWSDFSGEAFYTSSDLCEAYNVILADDRDVMIHMVEFGYTGEIRRDPGGPDKADWTKGSLPR